MSDTVSIPQSLHTADLDAASVFSGRLLFFIAAALRLRYMGYARTWVPSWGYRPHPVRGSHSPAGRIEGQSQKTGDRARKENGMVRAARSGCFSRAIRCASSFPDGFPGRVLFEDGERLDFFYASGVEKCVMAVFFRGKSAAPLRDAGISGPHGAGKRMRTRRPTGDG